MVVWNKIELEQWIPDMSFNNTASLSIRWCVLVQSKAPDLQLF